MEQWETRSIALDDMPLSNGPHQTALSIRGNLSQQGYSAMSLFCRKITQASRCSRALEVIVQARWVECFDARIQTLKLETPEASSTKLKMAVLKESCLDFSWSEKEMRNKM